MPRVLLLLPTTTYRTKAFIEAACNLGIDIAVASEISSTMSPHNPTGILTLNFANPSQAAQEIVQLGRDFDAIIPVDEDTAVVAAALAEALDIPYHSVNAALIAKNKYKMRQALAQAELKVPSFWHFNLDDNLAVIAAQISYPCVIKPVCLSTSRGVMRLNQPADLPTAVARLTPILARPEVVKRLGTAAREFIIESFIPGQEVALEGLLTNGSLKVLAIFDKPDPLDGPFFEETIYATPSRHSAEIQQELARTTEAAAQAIGLQTCPIHAELRINPQGVWTIEVAARAIGGLCSRTLSFSSQVEQDISLEELILRHALGEDISPITREEIATGVMMIPIPKAGILKEIKGLELARQVPGIVDIIISAPLSQKVAPPPEGSSYLGFIFSHAKIAEQAERALRKAHQMLQFIIQ